MRRSVVWLTGLAALCESCGGAAFDGRTFRNDEVAFRVGPVPAHWRRLDVDEALLAYRDDRRASTIAVTGRCGKDGDDVPLKALTHHLFLQFTDRDVDAQREMTLDGRAALRSELTAALDGVPKKFTVYVLKKDGCVYDFLHISDADQSTEDFDQFVTGFATVS